MIMPVVGSGSSANSHLGAVGMPVDTPAGLGVDRPIEGMGGIEAELLAELEHQRIPIILCDWRERRQCGWLVQ